MQMIVINDCDKRFVLLCRQLDGYLNFIVGGEKQKSQYKIYDMAFRFEEGKAIEELYK